MRSISGPHINTIMAVMSPPNSAETKVSAPRMRAAPMDARSKTMNDTIVPPVTCWPSPRLAEGRRRPQAWWIIGAMLALATAPRASQGQDSSGSEPGEAAAEAGSLPEGWTVRPDTDGKKKDVRFSVMEPGYHLTLGPAVILYRQQDRVKGPFHTLAKLHQTKKLEHAEGYGLFMSGRALDGPAQAYTYFLIRSDGQFLIKRREGDRLSEYTSGWRAHPAINKVDAKGASANLLEIDAKKDPRTVSFLVNGKEVHRIPAQRLRLEGIVGLRVNHNLDLHIEEFAIHQ